MYGTAYILGDNEW